jgi:integrase
MTSLAGPETDPKSRGTRRGNRQGSVYHVKSKDRYRATLDGRSKDFLTRGEADEYLRRALNQREHGAPAVANRQTLSAYLDHWLARRVARREIAVTTAQGYEGYIHVHIHASKLGKRRLDADGWPSAIDEFLTAKLASGLSLRTVEQIHAILRKAFADARRAGLVGFNPATTEYVAAVHPVRMPPTILSLEESERLIAEARGNRYEHLFMFLLATGARLGEASGLRWHDFDGRTPLVDLQRRRHTV